VKPLTLPEVAVHLGLSYQRVYQLVREGRLKAEKVGPIWLVHPREIHRFFAVPRKPGRPSQ
jgi:excisionase family DNA binding protein